MEREHFEPIGETLGSEGVERLVDHVETICHYERTHIDLTNKPGILRLRMELAAWSDEEETIGERLRFATPMSKSHFQRRSAWWSLSVALALTVSGFVFSLLALEPYRFGWKSYLLCVGIALICPYGIHKCLKEWDCRHLIRGLATVACAAALVSLILLAVIRGRLFMQELQHADNQVVVMDGPTLSAEEGTNFYQQTLPLLEIVMAFLALAMDLEAGLALHEAVSMFQIESGEDAQIVSKELLAVRTHMAALAAQIEERSNQGSDFEARFWRDFYIAMLRRTTQKALGKVLTMALLLSFGAVALRADQQSLNLAILIDLSASVASKGPDGKTDFKKNVVAVSELLAHVPSNSHITILGIRENSFAEPDILLEAEMPSDEGYFGERVSAAHRQIVRAWQGRAANLQPNAKQTDILGALVVTGQLFSETSTGTRKVVVIFSDMRQDTSKINLERSKRIGTDALRQSEDESHITNLSGVEVYALGVDSAGLDAAEWSSLRQFWIDYFERVHAKVRAYSILRTVSGL